MRKKKPATGDTEDPSIPTVSTNKSTSSQANSVLPLQTGPRASSPSRLHSPGEGAVHSEPALRRWFPASGQDASGPQSSWDHSREPHVWSTQPIARSEPFPTTSVQTYASRTGEKRRQNPVTSQQHLTPARRVGSFHVRYTTRENRDLRVQAQPKKPVAYYPPSPAVLIKTALPAPIFSPHFLTWCYNWIGILLQLSCKYKLSAALAFHMFQMQRTFDMQLQS